MKIRVEVTHEPNCMAVLAEIYVGRRLFFVFSSAAFEMFFQLFELRVMQSTWRACSDPSRTLCVLQHWYEIHLAEAECKEEIQHKRKVEWMQ